jgi:hypothetical protein
VLLLRKAPFVAHTVYTQYPPATKEIEMTATATLSTKQQDFIASCERHGWSVHSIERNRFTDGTTVVAHNGAGTEWAMMGAYFGERATRHSAMIRTYTGDYKSISLRKLFFTVANY